MKRKNILYSIIFILLFVLLSGCKNTEYITAYSTDYVNVERLKASEFNREEIEAKRYSSQPYYGYLCYVSKSNEYGERCKAKLVINNERPEREQSILTQGGCFVGFDRTESFSGVIFYPSSGGHHLGDKPISVLSDRCIGLFDIENQCYVITSWNYWDERVPISLYRLSPPTQENRTKCTVDKICDISNEYAYAATVTEDGVIYIVTDQSFYSVTIDGDITCISVPEVWFSLLINSIVELDGYIYLGTECGILRYTPDTDTFTWFPVEYEDIIPK